MNWGRVVDIIYPRRCVVCEEIIDSNSKGICFECVKKIEYVREPVCKKCGKMILENTVEYCSDCKIKKHTYIQNKSVFLYKGEIQKSIHRFKYENKREYASFFGNEILKMHSDWIIKCKPDCLIPIPLHKSREKQRGFNQAKLLADIIGEALGIPVVDNLLLRVKKTKPQKELNHADRKNNIKKSFIIKENIVELKKSILIDDIYTTGSTLNEAGETLKEAGIMCYGLTLSIGGAD